jgi:hypothetical protein
VPFSIPGKWFSSSRLILNSPRRAHRHTAPSGRSDFWILRACRPQLELRILRACLAQSKLWTSWACRACAAAQSCYNKREDRRLFVSAGTARSFAHLLPRKTCKAKLPALLLAFRPLEKLNPIRPYHGSELGRASVVGQPLPQLSPDGSVQPIHTPNNLDCWKANLKIVLIGFPVAGRIAVILASQG